MSDQDELDFEHYPNRAGFKKEGTSELAAEKIEPKRKIILRLAHRAIHEKPGTPDEIAARIRKYFGSVRPRCSELIALGYVEETGVRRENPISGGMAAELRSIADPDTCDYHKEND